MGTRGVARWGQGCPAADLAFPSRSERAVTGRQDTQSRFVPQKRFWSFTGFFGTLPN